MKHLDVHSLILLAVGLFALQTAQAQGTTTYLSSLSQTSTGSEPVGSNSWLAAGFYTGFNTGGYVLNSVQLGITDASGNPDNFTVLLCVQSSFPAAILPGNSIGTLSGSLDPVTDGIYTYTAPSNLILSPRTLYYVVLAAGTTVTNGAYGWSESAYPPIISSGWAVDNEVLYSTGTALGNRIWSYTPYLGIAQFAINATAVPEPAIPNLLSLGVLAFCWWIKMAQKSAGATRRQCH